MQQTQDCLYNSIGVSYNSTRQADSYIAQRLYSLLQPQPEGIYMDVGCGTGNYTIALTEKGLRLYGVEPSEVMLRTARERNSSIQWLQGSAEDLPFSDEAMNGAIVTLTIHHWQNLEKAFQEIYRVLVPNSNFVIFTSLPEQTERFWLAHYFPQMFRDSMHVLPSLPRIEQAARAAGFRISAIENYEVQDDLCDHFLYCGKNKPELYFNPTIRSGISSFAAFANAAEVEKGLQALAADIESGTFSTIQQQYQHNDGDYLFIRLEK